MTKHDKPKRGFDHDEWGELPPFSRGAAPDAPPPAPSGPNQMPTYRKDRQTPKGPRGKAR